MPMPKDANAAELAQMLDDMILFPHNTGGLSLLDEATGRFAGQFPELADAQKKFADARDAHKWEYSHDTSKQDQTWADAMTAAQQLAELLRPLGDTRVDQDQ